MKVLNSIGRGVKNVFRFMYLMVFGSLMMILAALIGIWDIVTFKNY